MAKGFRHRTRELYLEWKARRAGRRGIDSSIHRATRDVTGPTGWAFSATWEKLDQHGDAYMKSFDPRVPPSIFVSERDRLRHNSPMPLVERCIEDHPQARSATSSEPAAPTRPTEQSEASPPVSPAAPEKPSSTPRP